MINNLNITLLDGPIDTKESILSIFLIAEGFPVSQKARFLNHCQNYLNELLQFTPFNLLIANPGWINNIGIFLPAQKSGPFLYNVDSDDQLLFDTVLDPTAETLSLNLDKVTNLINQLMFREPVKTAYEKSPKKLWVVLTAENESFVQGGDSMFWIKDNQDLVVATSVSGFWVQVIIRAIGKILGLGDEFALSGEEYLAPSYLEGMVIQDTFPNLIYLPEPEQGLIPEESKWKYFFEKGLHETSLKINKLGDEPKLYNSRIELWEGGAGFRTKVIRSSFDCIQRRRIGDKDLPVRKERLSLCYLCREFIANEIQFRAKFHHSHEFEFRNGLTI